jgi:hypothetical protein
MRYVVAFALGLVFGGPAFLIALGLILLMRFCAWHPSTQ